MELRQLEQFVAVAEESHFARAAARCSVVPSALSTAIRVLERELGVALLRRTTRSVALTEAGQVFLVEARKTLAAAAAARAAVGDVRSLLSGSLAVGAVPTYGLLDLPGLLHRIHLQHPALNIRFTRDTSTALLDQVRNGRLDIAVLSLPDPAPQDLTVREIARGPVLLACHQSHPLAGRSAVTVADLAGESFIAGQPGSRGRDYVNQIFAAAGTVPQVPYEVNDIDTMLDFVEHGLGVALVIQPTTAGRSSLSTVPISDAAMTWVLGAVAPVATQMTPAARVLLTLIAPEADNPRR